MDTKQLIERFRKPVLITVGLVSLYALIGFVLLPKYMQRKIPELIETETGRKAALKNIDFNPFSLELSVQGFSMQEKDLQTFSSFEEFFVNVQVWSSLRHLALVLDELKLSDPFVRIEALKDGRYNFSDLSSEGDEEQPTEDSEGLFPLIIHKIALINGEFVTIDALQSEPINKVIENINLSLESFSTLPEDNAELGFSMALNGGSKLKWSGNFAVNPISSEGKVSIEGLQYTDIWNLFLQNSMQFKWKEGTQAVSFNYVFSYPEDEFIFSLSEGQLETKDLTFIGKENPSVFLTIPNLSIAGVSFDLNKQAVDIEKIESTGTDFKLWYEQSGELNYQAAFIGNESELHEEIKEEVQAQLEETVPWTINVQDIAINTVKVNYSDKRNKDATSLNVKTLDLGIKNTRFSLAEVMKLTTNQGYLILQDLSLQTDKDGELIKVPEVKISEIGLNLQDKNIKIESVNTSDAVIKAWLAKNGEINYQSLFAPTNQEQTEQVPETVSKNKEENPWLLELGEFKIDNYTLAFTDHTTKKPVSLNLTEVGFSINDFSNKKGTKLPLNFSARLNENGKIIMTGQSVLEPFSADLDIAVNSVGIAGFQPYVEQSARLDIVGGKFSTQGKLAISKAEHADLQLNYNGGVDINGLHTRDQILKQDFLKWQLLKLSGIEFDLQPTKLNIKSINLVKPYAKVTIKKDKTTNINDVIIEAEKAKKKPIKEAKKKAAPVVYKIAKIKIAGGESDFADYSLILPFVVHLNDLGGSVDNISSNKKAKTKVSLKGRTFDLSPVDIQGSFDANLDDLDMAMHYKSLPLPFLSPYMVEFSGNKIEKGKLSLDLMYKVKNGHLTSTNNLLIDQLELGEKVENPDAVDLPLGLAITLLKDKDGKITINMPVEGSMDDPEFSIGPVILDVFVNLITKAVASPFTAIGSFLGSDEDFSVITFQAGSAELVADQIVKLDGLATALTQKQDWPAMKEQALTDQLKQMRSEELKKDGEIKLPEYIQLSEDDYQRLLADLFIQKFPDLAKRSIFGTPKLIHPDMGEFNTVASKMLKGMIKPDDYKLLKLSLTRARNIARYMNENGGIDQARMFILDGKVTPDAENNELNADLSLKIQ